jgi:hypothetical protein
MKRGTPHVFRIAKMFLGAILLVIGLVALLTPLTPGSWLIFVGLELLGIRLIVWDKSGRIRKWLHRLGIPKEWLGTMKEK